MYQWPYDMPAKPIICDITSHSQIKPNRPPGLHVWSAGIGPERQHGWPLCARSACNLCMCIHYANMAMHLPPRHCHYRIPSAPAAPDPPFFLATVAAAAAVCFSNTEEVKRSRSLTLFMQIQGILEHHCSSHVSQHAYFITSTSQSAVSSMFENGETMSTYPSCCSQWHVTHLSYSYYLTLTTFK